MKYFSVSLQVPSIVDNVQKMLQAIARFEMAGLSESQLKDMKKRRLINNA